MNWVFSLLLLQYVISATAGLVHQVRGPANVRQDEIVAAGKVVQTGTRGFVEVQLHPGSYLRLRENSAAVFDSVALERIEVRLTAGNMLIESDSFDPAMPIKITAGKLVALIKKPGLYRFSTDTVKVVTGEVDLANGTRIRKGYKAVTGDDGTDVARLGDEEIQRPYAPDKIKVYVTPKKEQNHRTAFMNSLFAELCSNELMRTRDVDVVTEREQAEYVLVASGGRQIMYRRIFAGAELLRKSDENAVFSDTVTRLELDQSFLNPSREAVHTLVQHILRRMHWR